MQSAMIEQCIDVPLSPSLIAPLLEAARREHRFYCKQWERFDRAVRVRAGVVSRQHPDYGEFERERAVFTRARRMSSSKRWQWAAIIQRLSAALDAATTEG